MFVIYVVLVCEVRVGMWSWLCRAPSKQCVVFLVYSSLLVVIGGYIIILVAKQHVPVCAINTTVVAEWQPTGGD